MDKFKSVVASLSFFLKTVLAVALLAVSIAGGRLLWQKWQEQRILNQVVERLSQDSRVAEVLVTKSEWDEVSQRYHTTIKFLEYDVDGNPLEPKYFTFSGNIIQFQALVIRFADRFVKAGDKLRGKSAYLFLKAFSLEGEKTEAFEMTPVHTIPRGYKVPGISSGFEKALWEEFWDYALDPERREHAGIKNAQIEAPGSLFLPGTIYTLRIEHDGGLRIDTQKIPEILKGEKL